MNKQQRNNQVQCQKQFKTLAQKLKINHCFKQIIGKILIVSFSLLLNVQQVVFLFCFISPHYIGFIISLFILDFCLCYTFIQLIKSSEQELLCYETKQNENIQKAIGKIFKIQLPKSQSIEISSNLQSQEQRNQSLFCEHCSKNKQKYLFHCYLLNICLNSKNRKKYILFFIFSYFILIETIIANVILIILQKQRSSFEEIAIVVCIVLSLLGIFLLSKYLCDKNFKMVKKQMVNQEKSNAHFFKNQIFPLPCFTKQNQTIQLNESQQNESKSSQKNQIKFNFNIKKRVQKTKLQNQSQVKEDQLIKKQNTITESTNSNNSAGKNEQKEIQNKKTYFQSMLKFKARSRLKPMKESIDQTKQQYIRRFVNQSSEVQTPQCFNTQ